MCYSFDRNLNKSKSSIIVKGISNEVLLEMENQIIEKYEEYNSINIYDLDEMKKIIEDELNRRKL
jgi:hypothetical protein